MAVGTAVVVKMAAAAVTTGGMAAGGMAVVAGMTTGGMAPDRWWQRQQGLVQTVQLPALCNIYSCKRRRMEGSADTDMTAGLQGWGWG